MKSAANRTLKLFLSIGFLAFDGARRLFYRLVGKKTPGICTILYYHSVPAGYREKFARQMDLVVRLTKPMSLDRDGVLQDGTLHSAITFDDIFENVLQNALPELEKRQIPVTLFVTAGLLGQTASWWPESSREFGLKLASAGQLQQLSSAAITVGSHTMTHPLLTTRSQPEAQRELSLSRTTLQQVLGHEITLFSFPYSDLNDELIEQCREAGYRRIFGGQYLPSGTSSEEEFLFSRTPVEPTDWRLEFYLKLLGGYRWMPYAVSAKRALKSAGKATARATA